MEQFGILFSNRSSAGHALGAKLIANAVRAAAVLGIPRGGIPVAEAVVEEMGVPLDVLAVDVLGSGLAPEDVGASLVHESMPRVPGQGSRALNWDIKRVAGRPEIQDAIGDRERLLRRGLPGIDFRGKCVVVVDDGVATGATMAAAVHRAREKGAGEVVAAFPVGPVAVSRALQHIADSVVYLEAAPDIRAVGQYYAVYPFITDEDVVWAIRQNRSSLAA